MRNTFFFLALAVALAGTNDETLAQHNPDIEGTIDRVSPGNDAGYQNPLSGQISFGGSATAINTSAQLVEVNVTGYVYKLDAAAEDPWGAPIMETDVTARSQRIIRPREKIALSCWDIQSLEPGIYKIKVSLTANFIDAAGAPASGVVEVTEPHRHTFRVVDE